MSIAKKLTRMNMLVSGAALLMACAAFIAYDLVSFRESILYDLSIQTQIIGSNSNSALLFDDPHSAATTLSALKAAPNIVSAGIYTADGRPFAAYWRDGQGQVPALPPIPEGQTEAHWSTGKDVVLARSIGLRGKPTGMVYIQSDLRRLNARLQRYMVIAAIVLAASLLAARLVSSIFRRSTAEPIVHLAAIARTVSRDKDYSVRASSTGGRDELAVLVEAFNEMLTQIQKRDGALQEAHNELEQRVQERTTQLTAANKELEAFSYSVSHDLRAPLRSIDGFSQVLLEDYGDRLDEQGKQHLDRIRAGTQRMGSLIDDLLNLSRVTRGEIHMARLDMSALARSVVADLQKAQPERQVEFRIEDDLETKADHGLLRIVLENLLSNAWKFTSKHPSACIEFGKMGHNGAPAYFVRDDGAGFDPAYAARLFGAFQRLHAMTEFPGTGVGLATVQRIINRHGGRIWAESAVGSGATFYFTLAENGFVQEGNNEKQGHIARGR
jgi:signal transduction histidine kinase